MDNFINWLIDLVMGIPHTVLLILISFACGKGLKGVLIGVAVTHWTGLARIIRSEVLQIRSQQYIEVSRKLGIVQGLWNQIKNLVWLSNRKRKRCKLYSKSEGRSVSPGWRDRSDLQSGRGCSVSGTKSEDCESRRRY